MRGNVLPNLLLVAASLTLGIVLAEAVLRHRDAQGDISYESLTRSDVADLRALNYNAAAVQRGKMPSGPFRVLSFGDSFAYTIVQYGFTYHSVAARAAAAQSGKTVEFVNLGEPATSFYQYINAYRAFGAALEHDAVIFNIDLGNDLLDVAYAFVADDVKVNRLFVNLTFDFQTGEARNVGIPRKFQLRVMDYAYAVYLSLSGKIQPVAQRSRPAPYSFAVAELGEEAWLEHANTQLDNFDSAKLPALKDGYVAAIQFARFVQEIAGTGKRVLVVLSPNQAQVDGSVLDKVLGRYPRDAGRLDLDLSARLLSGIFRDVAPLASVIYLRPALACAAQKGISSYYKTDTHWSAEGNQFVGELLGFWVAEHWFGVAPKPDDCAGDWQPGTTADSRQHYESFIQPLLLSAPREGRLK